MKEQRGIIIILTTHEQQVAEYGSRIVQLKDGRIVSGKANDARRLARQERAEAPMAEGRA